MDARGAAKLIALGRVGIGAALVAAPSVVNQRWIGPTGLRPEVGALGRAVGIRDVILGGLALHTLDHPQVGPRMIATCAVADLVDLGGVVAARRHIPSGAFNGTVVLAGGSAIAGFAL